MDSHRNLIVEILDFVTSFCRIPNLLSVNTCTYIVPVCDYIDLILRVPRQTGFLIDQAMANYIKNVKNASGSYQTIF